MEWGNVFKLPLGTPDLWRTQRLGLILVPVWRADETVN